MKIFSVTIVQDQEDIIEENVRHHQPIFDDLYIWDIGSSDKTSEILKKLGNEFPNVHVKFEERLFANDLRGELFWEIRENYNENDWYYQLDSDEFLQSNIRPILHKANKRNKQYVRTYHFNFRLRKDDINAPFKNTSSRNYFKVDYSEVRAFKNTNDIQWPLNNRSLMPLGLILPINLKRPHNEFIKVYHYPFRSKEQLERRIESKRKLIKGPNYKEIKGINYRKYNITDIDTLLSNEQDLRNIKVSNKVHFSEDIKIRYKTVWKPVFNHIKKSFFKFHK